MQVAGFSAALERLGPFGAAPRLAVAVSGGADSTALALLTQDYCTARGGAVLALIIDHGLRAASAGEAALTASRLAQHGIGSRIITLRGLPSGAGLQAAARAARYAALEEAAGEAGVLHLLLGHHAADQEETVAMRAMRGPGGAEGMAAWSARGRVLLLRPLLGLRPELLRDYLRARGMAWVEDPSNLSEKFERVRVRQAGIGMAPATAGARVARETEAAAYLAAHAQIRPEGFALLDAAAAPLAALGALLRVVGGAVYKPREAVLARLAARLQPATLGGVRILPAGRLGPGWLLTREPAGCAAPVAAVAGAIWDGRFHLESAPVPGGMLGALADDAKDYRGFNGLPSAVLCGLAALRGPGGQIRFPAPVRFCPRAPAASHPFVA